MYVRESGSALNWRTLIVLEEGAEAEVWEHWSSPSDDIDALLNQWPSLLVKQRLDLRRHHGEVIPARRQLDRPGSANRTESRQSDKMNVTLH